MTKSQTPLERALNQQSETLAQSFFIIGAPISNEFFPVSDQQLLYKYPPEYEVSDKVIAFLKSPTPFERIALRKYMSVERMEAAVTILPGLDKSQYAVFVSHLEPVCLRSSLIPGQIILPSTVASFNVVRRFYVFICAQPHVLGLVQILKKIIEFDFDAKLAVLTSKKKSDHQLNKKELEELLECLIKTPCQELSSGEIQMPLSNAEMKGFPFVLKHTVSKTKKECLHNFELKYTSFYPLPNLMLLADFSIPILFTTLPTDLILSLFDAIISETSVIFTSTKPKLFTSSCFAFLCLMHPFNWQGLFLPLVPQSHTEVLDAPVPGIFGTQPLKKAVCNGGILCDVDSFLTKDKTLKEPMKLSIQLPQIFGNLEQLIENVKYKYGDTLIDKEVEFTTEILKIFWDYVFKVIIKKIIEYDVDTVDKLKKKLNEDTDIASDYKEFLSKLFETQHFNSWFFYQYSKYKEEICHTVNN